jgi:hypothetical protein
MGEVLCRGGLWCEEVPTVDQLWWWFGGGGGREDRVSSGRWIRHQTLVGG